MNAWGLIAGTILLAGCGLFQKMEVDEREAGPVTAVVLDHRGPYREVSKKIDEVHAYLDRRGIPTGDGIGVYYDKPGVVKPSELRSKGGVLVLGAVSVDPPYGILEIPAQPVLHTSFRGHPALGALKAYRAFGRRMRGSGREASGPAWEVYRRGGDGMVTEYYLPVSAKAP